ncbi:MAG: hypothetical protein K8L99_26625 [Anaerolineae bacterium]|nr:hypothetical protein [Anaerolineae bacterium]
MSEQINRPSLAVKRYPVLRIMGVVYKVLAIVALVFCVAWGIYVTVRVPDNPMEAFLNQGAIFIAVGVAVSISSYVLSRLIDLLLETNNQTRRMVDLLQEQNRLLKQIYRRQANPYPRVTDAIGQRKERLTEANVYASPD